MKKYKTSDFVSSEEALIILGLYKPGNAYKNVRWLKWLSQRGLLTQIKTNPRVLRYFKTECEELFNRHIIEGISLTAKPTKKAA